MKDRSYSLEQFGFIMNNCGNFTARGMAEHLKLPIHIITGIGYRHGLEFKKVNKKRDFAPDPEFRLRHQAPASLMPDPEPVKTRKRIPGVYNNIPSPMGISTEMREL